MKDIYRIGSRSGAGAFIGAAIAAFLLVTLGILKGAGVPFASAILVAGAASLANPLLFVLGAIAIAAVIGAVIGCIIAACSDGPGKALDDGRSNSDPTQTIRPVFGDDSFGNTVLTGQYMTLSDGQGNDVTQPLQTTASAFWCDPNTNTMIYAGQVPLSTTAQPTNTNAATTTKLEPFYTATHHGGGGNQPS